MSVRYVAVTWNRQKRIYDLFLAGGVLGSLLLFAGLTFAVHPDATAESALIRGLGLTAFLLLHVILVIGPLARLDSRFLPLLYNRRHLGVTTGLLALGHAAFSVFQYHALGNVNPLVSLLTSNLEVESLTGFPFEWAGLAALVILVLLAATSHDYWLSVLTPPAWKRLHMAAYLAYLLLVAHVGLGILQDERHWLYAVALGMGVALVGGLHVAAALRETKRDREPGVAGDWIDVCGIDEIEESRARVAVVAGERVAVFRHEGRLSCVSNVCKHQNGPLGEGRIIDGCITCPWHGYQYRPETGASPPPFNDSIPTFNLRVAGERVEVYRYPNPPGTYVEPVHAGAFTGGLPPAPTPSSMAVGAGGGPPTDFYVGYHPNAPPSVTRFTRAAVVTMLLLSGAVITAFALAQRTFASAAFDYGHDTVLEGTIRSHPYPMLEVERPGEGQESLRRYLLAAPGKHGAHALIDGLAGRRARLTGPVARRGNLTLLEIGIATPLADSASGVRSVSPRDLGTFALEGEIADSKCYLGVMNPGQGKAHRGCAARCLSGGLTPLFVVRGVDGAPLELILVNQRNEPVDLASKWAGRPVRLQGRVLVDGDLRILQVDPASVRPIS